MIKTHITVGNDLKVFRVGLGTNRIHDDNRSKEALKKAVKLGIDFIDTASAYANGESEKTIGEVLSHNEDIVFATKGGMSVPDFHIDASPKTLKEQLDASLQKLKLQTISLYFLHRVDPHVPLKESILFLKQMQAEGKIKHIGLSQVSVEEIEEARKYIDVVAVENGYNLSERNYDDVLQYAERENLVFIPFFPLHFGDTYLPVLQELQKKYNATPAQLALAWLLKRSPQILPIPGSLSETHLKQNVDAVKIEMTDDDFKMLSDV